MGQVTDDALARLRERERRHDLVLLRRMAARATILPIDTLGRATAQTYPERMLRPDGGHRA